MPPLPKVLLVGGIDVDARLELMRCLAGRYDIGALGSRAALRHRFEAEKYGYATYTLSRGANPFIDLFTLIQLLFVFCRMKPQLVHTFDTKPCVWGRIAARLSGVPVVVGTIPGLGSLYTGDSRRRLLRSIYQRLQQLACHLSDLTIFQNHHDALQFVEAGVVSRRKTVIIPGSGVSTELFDPARVPDTVRMALRAELGFGADAVIITMVSRVIRSKGICEFGTAAQKVCGDYPEARFLLIGSEDTESLDRLTADDLRALKQAVTWPGSRRDIPAILAISDIFALPSAYREGMPRVLLEAASMGLPIVTTNSPGCSEVVEDGVNGLLIPAGDAVALSQAIECLIEQPELRQRFGEMSRRRAVDRFDIRVIAAQTGAVYERLLAAALEPTTGLLRSAG